MDLALIIKNRLEELKFEQKDLAIAAQVTESYISQLLARKKAPPSTGRTEIYARMSRFLKLPEDALSKLADIQRHEELKKKVEEPLRPLYAECRDLILRKCALGKRREVRAIFEKDSFGELERFITQMLLDVAKTVAQHQLRNEKQLQSIAKLTGRTPQQTRRLNRKFVEAASIDVSPDLSVSFLEPLIQSWDIDLKTFALDIALDRNLAPGPRKRFEFVERAPEHPMIIEPGLKEFLANRGLSGDANEEELLFLKALRFNGKRPTAIYYYRELQNLRDPLHFRPAIQREI